MATTIYTPSMLRNGTRGVPEISGGGGGGGFTNKYSLNFDGVDDYLDCGDVTTLDNASTFTYSGWYNQTTLNQEAFMFGSQVDATNYIGFYTWSDGNLYIDMKQGSIHYGYFDYSLYVTAGQWFHFAVVFNGSGATTSDKIKCYINGALITLTLPYSFPTSTPTGTNITGIGKMDTFSQTWNGSADECSLFSTAKTGLEITDIYNLGTPTDLSALAGLSNWYRNGDNGTWKSPQWLIPSNENKDKVSNYSFDFDGVDDFIDCGEIPPLFKYYPIGTAKDNTWSASMWVKGSTSGGFFEIPYIQSNSLNAFSFGFLFGGSYLYFGGKYAQIKMKETGTTAYSITNWNHIVMTFDGIDHTALSSYTLYVGGVPIVMELITVNLADYRTENISIGVAGSDGSPSYWDGNIDEVSLFGIELTQPQVTDIYNSGTPTTLPSGAVAHYKMGEGSIFTNNWLVDNSATTAYSTRSFNFDGVDDYINTGVSALDGATSFTLSTWVNTSYNDWQNLFGDNSFRLALKQSINRIDITFNGVVVQQASDFTLTLGQWHHIAITFDASLTQIDRIKVYLDDFRVNNLLVGTTATSYIANNNFMIGRVGTQITKEWNGSIDEFATFNSVQNITDLYNGGTPTTITGATNWWRMGEDASFNTNWNVPDQVGSATGTSANMTIGDLTGEAPNYTGGGTSANMTLEDRLGEAPNSSNNAVSLNMDEVDRETDVPA